jgi:hypothetical protein
LAIAISAIFKKAAAKTKWQHFHTAWLHVLSIYCHIYHCLAVLWYVFVQDILIILLKKKAK